MSPLKSLVFVIFLLSDAYGQETIRCSHNLKNLSKSQISENNRLEIEFNNYLKSNFRIENGSITIPVVIHNVYNLPNQKITEEQVYDQISILNKDYSRTNTDTAKAPGVFKKIAGTAGIKFKLAVQDPLGKPTNGITYTYTSVSKFSAKSDNVKFNSTGGEDAWDTKSYLNIWVCHLDVGILGYYGSDSVSEQAGKNTDGVAVSYRAFSSIGNNLSPYYNLGRTSTHEIGHWLGLYHLWGPFPDSHCSSDFVSDTPQQNESSNGCPIYPYIDSNCPNSPYGRNFSNFMDYSYDACMNMFTQGQVERMNAVFNISRQSLLISKALYPPFNVDIALSIVYDTLGYCQGKKIYPKARVFNYGKDTITEYTISILYNNDIYQYQYTGKLNPLTDTLWSFNDISISTDEVSLTAQVSLDSSLKDEYPSNNVKEIKFACIRPLSIYPNPVTEILYIEGNLPRINRSLIYNLQGAEVLRTENTTKIDVTGLEPGFYLIVLETDAKAIRKQLIVIH